MNNGDFECAERVTVMYRGLAYDDARRINGLWFYRDPATRQMCCFAFQDQVIAPNNDTASDNAVRVPSPSNKTGKHAPMA